MEQQNVRLVEKEVWKALAAHREEQKAKQVHMRDLFAQDPERFRRYSFEWNDGALLLDYSKNIITDDTLRLLRQLAADCDIKGWTEKMFSGEKINFTENRYHRHHPPSSTGWATRR
jgi:glucose-6-phosphate isomerase